MAFTSAGYDGTVLEPQWAAIFGLSAGAQYACLGDDLKVSAVSGQRQVSVAAGRAVGYGVVSTETAATLKTLTTPASGTSRWDLIVLRRNWTTNTDSIEVITGTVINSTATPTAVPSSFPSGRLTVPGTGSDDQPLAWVFTVFGSTSLIVIDLRTRPAYVPKRGNATQRDAYWGAPGSVTAAQAALDGADWFNTTSGCQEVYCVAGAGVVESGWYPIAGRLPLFETDGDVNWDYTAGIVPVAYEPTPQVNRGFTSWNQATATLTIAQTGEYEFEMVAPPNGAQVVAPVLSFGGTAFSGDRYVSGSGNPAGGRHRLVSGATVQARASSAGSWQLLASRAHFAVKYIGPA